VKVTIEYTLPEEREEMEQAVKGHEYAAALYEIDGQLRSLIKYNTDLTQGAIGGLQMARDLLHKAMRERGVELI